MKKTLITLFFGMLSILCIAQPAASTYRTLTQVCLDNQPGSGKTPQNIKFYTLKTGLAIGNPLWKTNIVGRTLLRPGSYYVIQGNKALKVGLTGLIENVIGCATGTVVPSEPQDYLISTTPNVINWGQFGNFQLTFGEAHYGFGTPRFLNETGSPSDPLSHGWTHSDAVGLNTIAELPPAKAMKFITLNQTIDNALVSELLDEGKFDAVGLRTSTENLGSVTNATAYLAGRKLYYHIWGAWDPQRGDYNARIGMPMIDEEVWHGSFENRGRIMNQMIAGMKAEASGVGKTVKPVMYGYLFNNCIGSFISNNGNIPFSEQRFFPNHSDTEIESFKNPNAHVSQYLNQTGIQHGLFPYFKVPYPMTESLYKKDAQGNYVIVNGKRVWRDTDYTETQYNQTVNFYASPKDVDYYTGNEYLPESWYAAIQPFALYSHYVFGRMGFNKFYNNNYNITNRDDFASELVAIVRDETEGTYFSMTNKSRPISPYLAEFQVYLPYLLGIRNFEVWTDYGPRSALSEPGAYPVRPYGQNYKRLRNGVILDEPRYWGTYEVYTACLKYLQDIQNKYNIFSGTEKYWQATAPSDKTNQVLLFGVLSGNNLVVFGTDFRLDKTDEITVNFTLSNVSGYNTTFKIKGRKHFINVIQLPAGSYTTDNLRFQYNDLYGSMHKHTGNLQNPNW